MREAFNNNSNTQNKQKLQTKAYQQQQNQLSQRSAQPFHQKTNSVGGKVIHNNNYNVMGFDEQQYHAQATLSSQQSILTNNQFQQQMNMQQMPYHLQQNDAILSQQQIFSSQNPQQVNQGGLMQGAKTHKKSNSLMNSKIAQMLLKNNPSNNQGNQQHQLVQKQQQQLQQQIQNQQFKPMNNPTTYNNNTNLQQQQQQYFYQAQLMASAQNQNIQGMAPNSQIDLKHQNKNMSNNLTNSIIAGGPVISHQSSFSNHTADIGSGQQSVDYKQHQPTSLNIMDENEEIFTRNLNALKQIQQISQHQSLSKQQQKTIQLQQQAQIQQMNLDAYIQQNLMNLHEGNKNIQVKKQQATLKDNLVSKAGMGGNSAQKNSKKVYPQSTTTTQSYHQRTKSDTYHNRGSLGKGQQPPSSVKKNQGGGVIHQNQQNVKQLIEAHQIVNSRQIINPSNAGTHQKTGSINFVMSTTESHQNTKLIVKKVPNSANHSKKPSINNTIYQQHINIGATNQNNSKKSQVDKYNELKAMYDDLLERHYAQQNQLQESNNQDMNQKSSNIVNSNQNQISNTINFQKIMQQVPQNFTIQAQNDQYLIYDNQQNQNTPRINKLNAKIQQPQHQLLNLQKMQNELNAYQNQIIESNNKNIIQIPAKLLKQQTVKQEAAERLLPKTTLKMNLPQGQSRKNAAGRHKRSVSDGNEQLFKFKQQQQQQMQRFLYPQPSNQTIKTINSNTTQQTYAAEQQYIAAPMNSEETINSNRNRAILSQQQSSQNFIQMPQPYQQPAHYRRVSDDYMQKQKKSQQILQNSNNLLQQQELILQQNLQYSNNHSKNTGLSFIGENLNSDGSQQENQKLKTIDFNIKGFLLEMRNKHHQNIPGGYGEEDASYNVNMKGGVPNNTELINIIDEQYQQQYTYSPQSPMEQNNRLIQQNYQNKYAQKNGKQFAMIIEENPLYQNSPIEMAAENYYQKEQEQIMIHGQSFEEPKSAIQNLLDSQRKHLLIADSQSNQLLYQVGNKNNLDFKKNLRSVKNQKMSDSKRSSSPNIQEFDKKQTIFAQKNHLVQVSHKRVKSDMPEVLSKKQIQGSISSAGAVNFNIPQNIMHKNQQLANKKADGVLNTIIKQKVLQQPNISSHKLQVSNSKNGSGLNLYANSDKNTPKKVITKQILNFGIAPEQLYQKQQKISQQFDVSDDKKVINVSVDLMKDGFSAGILVDEDLQENISFLNDSNYEPNIQEGEEWPIQNHKIDQKPMSQQIINNIPPQSKHQKLLQQQKQPITRVTKKQLIPAAGSNSIQIQHQNKVVFSGGNELIQRHDKYKKMIQKYDGINNNSSLGNNIKEVNEANQNGSKSNRKNTFDIGNSIGNSSCLSPSGVFLQPSPKNRLSINDKNIDYKKQKSTKQILQASPKNLLMGQQYQRQKQVKIQNLMQPMSSKQNYDKQVKDLNNSPNLSNTKQINLQDNNPPNNSAVQTQETPRSSVIIQANLIIPQNICERVDTQDSTVSDPNLSPRSRGVNKLIKHIKLSFRQTSQPPNTTVDFYRIGKVLGKGAFGKVNLALHKLTGKFAAVKSINKQYLSEEAQTKKVMQEVVILKRTRHRNIVRLYEFFETQKHILFVIELCAGGDLLNYVRRRRRLKEDVAKSIFKQIIEGLGYCHSKQILHRDIKLDNILLDSEGEVKICDFGVSKIVKKGEIMTEQCGTPAYIAPEILRDKGYEGFAVDIWSAGVVLYAMLYGTVPFKANNMSELQKLIIKANYTLKDDISEEARTLLTGLLEKDPHKRLTIEQILQHQWLLDASDKIQLFTQQEKDYIKNEFTYNDTDRFNRNEADPFTDHMLDSTNNSMLKNQTSKSVILAPFNSTKSDLQANDPALTESMKALLQTKQCIKFAPRVRDIDKQYEINNNAELDNGVYHKLEDEEEEKAEEIKNKDDEKRKKKNGLNQGVDSLESSFNKESSMKSDDDEESLRIHQKKQETKKQASAAKEKQTELQKLESMIYQQEDEFDNPYQENNNNKDQNPNDQILIRDELSINKQQQLEISIEDRGDKSSPRTSETRYENSASRGGYHHNHHYGLQTAQTLIVDEFMVAQIEIMGYPREYIVKCLNNNELNYATSGYYLLQNEHALSFGNPLAQLNGNGTILSHRAGVK